MAISDKTDVNCDYNEVANDEDEEQMRNHVKYKKDPRVARSESYRKFKKIIGHVGLLITLMLYTAAGGLVRMILFFIILFLKMKNYFFISLKKNFIK